MLLCVVSEFVDKEDLLGQGHIGRIKNEDSLKAYMVFVCRSFKWNLSIFPGFLKPGKQWMQEEFLFFHDPFSLVHETQCVCVTEVFVVQISDRRVDRTLTQVFCTT